MLKITIVEDQDEDEALLERHLTRYSRENNLSFDIAWYKDGLKLLAAPSLKTDIFFLDIEMPNMNGLEVAASVRKSDPQVPIIFISKSSQYAIRGFEVDAIGYVLKPATYFNTKFLLDKAIHSLSLTKDSFLVLPDQDGLSRVPIVDIAYVEVRNHDLLFHLGDGKTRMKRDSMKNVEKDLSGKGFAKCNNCYLVNLRFVQCIKRDSVLLLEGTELLTSRSRRTSFEQAFLDYARDFS